VTRSRQAVLAIAVTAVLTSIPPSARFDGRGTETMLAPVAAVAGPASESGDPHIRGFLTPDGQIDSEAIASSDYEGPISFAGLDARLSGDSNGALSLLPAGDLRRSNDQWCPGFGQPPGGNGLDNVVHALAIYKNRLIAGGDFLTASGVWLNHIAQWTGEEWIALDFGLEGSVYAITVYEGYLYAGGSFQWSGVLEPVPYVGVWNGNEWQGLGFGPGGPVRALVGSSWLIAGGEFPGFVARFVWPEAPQFQGPSPPQEPSDLDPVEGAWLPLVPPVSGPVRTLTLFQGEVIAGGDFAAAGGAPANFIARWDGNQWHGMPEGGGSGFNGRVHALTLAGDNLIAGGEFTASAAGGLPLLRVASWDGFSWTPLGAGLSGTVRSLAYFSDRIHAGGDFSHDGTGITPLFHVGVFQDGEWQALGSGMSPPGASSVRALAVQGAGARLFVGGDFVMSGDKDATHIGLWSNAIIKGFITDNFNGRPVFEATIVVANDTHSNSTLSDRDGFYELGVEPGSGYEITVTHSGYRSQSVEIQGTLEGCSETVRDFELDTRTVVLAHGWPSDQGTWLGGDDFDFAATLAGLGSYRVETLNLMPTLASRFGPAGRVRRQAQALDDSLTDLRNEGVMSVDVIAHSTGGIVSRYLIQEIDGESIRELIMLGVPNHGTEVSRIIKSVLFLIYRAFIPDVAAYALAEATLPPALRDLNPGSDLLDQLNYDDQQNSQSNWRCRRHNDETTLGSTTQYSTYTGHGVCGALYRTIGTLLKWVTFCGNDAIIPTASVPLRVNNTPSNVVNKSDDDCNCNSTHFAVCTQMTEDLCVAEAVHRVLQGEELCSSETSPDVLLDDVPAPKPAGHFLLRMLEGEIIEEAVTVGSADTLVFWAGWLDGEIDLSLRDPNNVVITMNTTNPDITYSEEEGYAQFSIEGGTATPGTWTMKAEAVSVPLPDTLAGAMAAGAWTDAQMQVDFTSLELRPSEEYRSRGRMSPLQSRRQ
jgi:hypothetical protein